MGMLRSGAVFLLAVSLWGADGDTKQRVKNVRQLGKGGSESIEKIVPFLSDPVAEVRLEAVKAIVEIGTGRVVDPLVRAAADTDAEVQIRATDGLVNFYSPGYVKAGGWSGTVRRAGTAIRSQFSPEDERVVDPWIDVRPEVNAAVAKLVSDGATMNSRAAAAKAAGVLRARVALDPLIAALRTKDDQLMRESLIAVQKIRDNSAGPRVMFLLRDLNESVQLAAIETVGILRTPEAVPDLRDVLTRARANRVRRAALGALAMIPDPASRPLYVQYLADKDDGLRAAAAEGLARLNDRNDLAVADKAFEGETKMNPRLSAAFAAVALGHNALADFSPLRYLVDTLNSASYNGVARPFLIELARDPGVRRTLYGAFGRATRDEKIGLAKVLAASGDHESVGYLETLGKDPDAEVAAEALRCVKVLRARL
jgi:HEAT repeat protein